MQNQEQTSENRSFRNAKEKLKKRRLGVFNVGIEGTVDQVGFYPG
jgi:hypothetical protein